MTYMIRPFRFESTSPSIEDVISKAQDLAKLPIVFDKEKGSAYFADYHFPIEIDRTEQDITLSGFQIDNPVLVELLDFSIRELGGIQDNVAKPALVFPIAIQLVEVEAGRLQSQLRRAKVLGGLFVLLLSCLAFAAVYAIVKVIAHAV